MHPVRFTRVCFTVWAAAVMLAASTRLPADANGPNMKSFANPTGVLRTYNVNGAIDFDNEFFQSIGTNGRSCATCHAPSDGWSITPAHVQERFDDSDGLEPLFRTNDGSNAPSVDVSTLEARRAAFSMLLRKGLIRVGIGMPAVRDFDLVGVDDPYGFASASELSLFRRPLPATNLSKLATVMWDGRETFPDQSIHFDLSDQANGATLGHAAAVNPLTDAQRESIVRFESGLYTAQASDNSAGVLNAQGANGGPMALSKEPFSIGINDPFVPGFTPRAFTLFDAWRSVPSSDNNPYTAARAAIARGQEIFNTRTFVISDVRGLNDRIGGSISGTCSTCHDAPNVGDHSVSLPVDLGLTDQARRTPDMPLYTFRNTATGEIRRTTDPGRALITGHWADLSTFKGPILRGLAARAPYFHNGLAATLADVVDFYDTRFNLQLTAQEKADLVAFLRAL